MTTETRSLARKATQVGVIVALLVAGFLGGSQFDTLRAEKADETARAVQVEGTLAVTCTAANNETLRDLGLLGECGLAQRGELGESLDTDTLPSAGEKPDEVDPNVVDDDDVDVPIPPALVTDEQVAVQVDAYFARNPLPTAQQYQQAIRRTVGQYLTKNPPAPGRAPTQGEVQDAVRTALVANPPDDGVDGQDGVGVAVAGVDGCDVVFTFTDGRTQRLGPLCGPQGEPGALPSDTQVAGAFAAYCVANGECRGPAGPPGIVRAEDTCQQVDGEVVIDVDLGYDETTQTITVDCVTAPGLVAPGGTDDGGEEPPVEGAG